MIDRRLLASDTKDGLLLSGWKQASELQTGDIIYGIAIKQVASYSSMVKRITFSIVNASTNELVNYINTIGFAFTLLEGSTNKYGFCSFVTDTLYNSYGLTANISFLVSEVKNNNYYCNNVTFSDSSYNGLTDDQLLTRSRNTTCTQRTTYGQGGGVDVAIFSGYYMTYPFLFKDARINIKNSAGSTVVNTKIYLRYDGAAHNINDEMLFLTENPIQE